MDMQLVQRFVVLTAYKKLYESQAKALGDELSGIEDRVMQEFEQADVQNMNVTMAPTAIASVENEMLESFRNKGIDDIHVDGRVCVYLSRQLWAKVVDGNHARACTALRAAGLDDLIEEKFNTNTLSAYVRELVKGHEDDPPDTPLSTYLPPSFQGAIDVTEKHSVKTRKAG